VWNEANFAEVQLLLGLRGIMAGRRGKSSEGSRSVFGAAVHVGGFILGCCDWYVGLSKTSGDGGGADFSQALTDG